MRVQIQRAGGALFALALAACASEDPRGPLAPPPVFPEPPAPIALLPLALDCSEADPMPEGVFSGAATAVIDGDSFCVGEIEVRLRRLDAPEWDQPGGPEAREDLRAVLSAAPDLACEAFSRSFDRVIATCLMSDGRPVELAVRSLHLPRGGGQ
jgi:endonuclease YncB( thermonuclease family)